jgi:hypothetical protein
MTLSETRERLRKERAEDAVYRSGLGQASDHTLGDNNIGDGPYHLSPCEARRDESWLTVAVLETLSNLPCTSLY